MMPNRGVHLPRRLRSFGGIYANGQCLVRRCGPTSSLCASCVTTLGRPCESQRDADTMNEHTQLRLDGGIRHTALRRLVELAVRVATRLTFWWLVMAFYQCHLTFCNHSLTFGNHSMIFASFDETQYVLSCGI